MELKWNELDWSDGLALAARDFCEDLAEDTENFEIVSNYMSGQL